MLCLRLALPVALAIAAALVCWRPMVALAESNANNRAAEFVKAHVAKVRPLEVASNLAWWNANVSGRDEDFKEREKAQNRIDEALSNPTAFAEVKEIKTKGGVNDPIVAREIDLLYLQYLEKQVDPSLLKQIV